MARDGEREMRDARCLIVKFSVLLAVLATSSCTGDGHFTFLGYTTKPPYRTDIHTVYVPIFKNKAFQSGPLRGLENELTKSVQRKIEQVTPYKVVWRREDADTELLGTIVRIDQALVNRNQLNEIREAEVGVQIEIVWRDLRSCEILSKPEPPPGTPMVVITDPNVKVVAPPVLMRTTGRYLPELGESQTTALKRATDQMAVDIVSLMEAPW
jgi:hypothetical protein